MSKIRINLSEFGLDAFIRFLEGLRKMDLVEEVSVKSSLWDPNDDKITYELKATGGLTRDPNDGYISAEYSIEIEEKNVGTEKNDV